uniref:Uncharacterized protein n=1 Tax=Romanomermis culicivorax TaxID=13658 RepID=A0A915HI01_ROMCU
MNIPPWINNKETSRVPPPRSTIITYSTLSFLCKPEKGRRRRLANYSQNFDAGSTGRLTGGVLLLIVELGRRRHHRLFYNCWAQFQLSLCQSFKTVSIGHAVNKGRGEIDSSRSDNNSNCNEHNMKEQEQ